MYDAWWNYVILICQVHSGSASYCAKRKVDGRSALYQGALYKVEFHYTKENGAYGMAEVKTTKMHCA